MRSAGASSSSGEENFKCNKAKHTAEVADGGDGVLALLKSWVPKYSMEWRNAVTCGMLRKRRLPRRLRVKDCMKTVKGSK